MSLSQSPPADGQGLGDQRPGTVPVPLLHVEPSQVDQAGRMIGVVFTEGLALPVDQPLRRDGGGVEVSAS
jgi:hypothetical protein